MLSMASRSETFGPSMFGRFATSILLIAIALLIGGKAAILTAAAWSAFMIWNPSASRSPVKALAWVTEAI